MPLLILGNSTARLDHGSRINVGKPKRRLYEEEDPKNVASLEDHFGEEPCLETS